MKKAIIGILPSKYGTSMGTSRNYLDALWNSGALGVILSYTDDTKKIREYVDMFDGFLFSGGVDIDPIYYGEKKLFDSVEIEAERDLFEFNMFTPIYESKKPILGICRGIQVLNVFMGGTLYQHMENHMQSEPGTQPTHMINVTQGSLLEKITGQKQLFTNSFHHQNIKKIGNGLSIDALSEDGYIECIHAPEHPFFMGIQWHPEMYCNNDPCMQKIFDTFVNACVK